MLAERVIEWAEEWKRQGLEQGRQEGQQKGRQEGEAAMLLHLLDWGDRLLTARSLADVFGDDSAAP